MKTENKFIALGLGLSIATTGTYFSYSWFTDSEIQSNKISIGRLIEDIISGKVDVGFGDLNNKDHKKITIYMSNIIDGNINDFTILEGKGSFKYVEKFKYENNMIVIAKKSGNFNDIDKDFTDEVTIKIIREKTNNEIYEDTYKFNFKRNNGNDLECLYELISSDKIKIEIEDENVNDEDQILEEVPPINDDTVESPDDIKPGEINPQPPIDVENPDIEQAPIEESPSQPDDNIPSTEEDQIEPPKINQIEPPIDLPKEDPQPDTPTVMPLD